MESGEECDLVKCGKEAREGWNSWIVAEHRARDRLRWREDVAVLCVTWHEGDN